MPTLFFRGHPKVSLTVSQRMPLQFNRIFTLRLGMAFGNKVSYRCTLQFCGTARGAGMACRRAMGSPPCPLPRAVQLPYLRTVPVLQVSMHCLPVRRIGL